ncbi:hypothetical protein [Streptomyces griseomycini]|uniref:Uncharacterized protein n=1 Tax=Streptomyces griseomycini TaxID=66895 RepID=A0A7W7PRC0_9ACTN|nr:hypothetical protein [Streptomyces griseomycini]MBB4898533.1 hypothetical protein [Streptomyces griseomycini]GGQ16682.1 hypothetical protein GCM10010266_44920 [Streptomyces griseomycini]GGR27948.1 hypothetical protein GCM10015536_36830 [Streptomyces griseomycini]
MHDPTLPFPEPEDSPFTGGGGGPPVVTDEIFGAIEVRLDGDRGSVAVEGGDLPHALVVRSRGAAPNRYAPIGTRDRGHLTLTLDDRRARIVPARAWLPRRSYRVDVMLPDTRYRLVPCSATASRLLRDRQCIGEFTSRGDGSVTAAWGEHAEPVAQDAAVGYLLAAAFGTGSRTMTDVFLDALDALLPH